MKYVKKPIVIEAVQWNGENWKEIFNFLGGENSRNQFGGNVQITGKNFIYHSVDPLMVCTNVIPYSWCQLTQSNIIVSLTIKTLEGDMQASIGDYIIKGIKGEYYPCKPDIFEQSYDVWADKETDSDANNEYPERDVQEKSLTFGETLMGITFNPSGNQTVNEIKTKFAEITDLINKHYEDRTDYQFEALIIFQNCLQHLLDAQMNCVKLVTYKQN
jgi:hypothetical protein